MGHGRGERGAELRPKSMHSRSAASESGTSDEAPPAGGGAAGLRGGFSSQTGESPQLELPARRRTSRAGSTVSGHLWAGGPSPS